MQVTTAPKDAYTLEASISLDRSELDAYVRRAKDELAGQVTVEGFRKGKAPQHLIDQQVGEAAVRAEALEIALGESFTLAVGEQQWDVMRTTDLKVKRNEPDGLEYAITVHLWPTVTLPDLDSVKVARKSVTVSDQEVEESLDTVRNMKATFLDKTGPAEAGDRLEVDFDASLEGTPIDGGSSRNHPLIVGGKAFMPGFEEQLVGLSSGMSKEFTLAAPSDYYEPKLAGKNVDFKITVRRVQTVLKPAADDAFAKALGRFADLGELKESIRQGLTNEKETREHQRLRLAILDGIIAAGQVPAPDAMVTEELDQMLHRFGHDLQGQGIELSMYLARMNKTEDQVKADWKPEAERQVRIMLVLRQIAKAHGIGVSDDELQAAIAQTMAEVIKSGQATEAQIDPERMRSALAERMLRDKVLGFVEERCAA